MSAVILTPAELALLKQLTPDLNFDDAERTAALLEAGSRDFNAVPGSGKTSLLAAKLLLLASKWPHAHKGICILSHTNVAREEISRRLVQTEEGSRLLAYPHFIGTIHGFVNQFLALQALRALEMHVEVIDDDVFANRAMTKLSGNRFSTLRAWLKHQPNGEVLLTKLRFSFTGEGLDIVSDGGDLPSETSTSGKQLRKMKNEIADDGVFRHSDMFAFAEVALAHCPDLLDVVHRRFPMVFIDEMQDTSWEQESLLNRLFADRSIVQRFGDVDQKIISNNDDDKATFPRVGHGTISTSKRFGARIADAVARVRLSQLPVAGEASDDISPVLLLYKSEDVGRVMYRFGHLLAERFDADALRGQTVRAMCARKSVDGGAEPGRHLGEYWPPYAQAQNDKKSSGRDSFWRLIEMNPTAISRATLAERASDVRKAILQVLRAANAPVAKDARDGRALIRSVAEQRGNVSALQQLVLDLALKPEPYDTPQARDAFLESLFGRLGDLLPEAINLEAFKVLEPFALATLAPAGADLPTVCTVVYKGRPLQFSIGTVASMKGETHFASLVLESYGGRSKRFDLELALQCIAGLGKGVAKLSATQREQMRNVYVAMSRPTRFLCLAVNESRVSLETRQTLETKGWQIEHLTRPG